MLKYKENFKEKLLNIYLHLNVVRKYVHMYKIVQVFVWKKEYYITFVIINI